MRIEWEQYLHDVAVYGQGMIYLEEKPVKQIDFSKPLRTNVAGYPARVVKEGMTVLEYETQFNIQRIVVDETGAVYAREKARPIGAHNFVVENVPEELYLRVCRNEGRKSEVYYSLDGAGRGAQWEGYDDQQALPLRVWKRYYGDQVEANGRFLVKVPA